MAQERAATCAASESQNMPTHVTRLATIKQIETYMDMIFENSNDTLEKIRRIKNPDCARFFKQIDKNSLLGKYIQNLINGLNNGIFHLDSYKKEYSDVAHDVCVLTNDYNQLIKAIVQQGAQDLHKAYSQETYPAEDFALALTLHSIGKSIF